MGKKAARKQDPDYKLIASNKKANHNFDLLEKLEAGIVLKGNEVKSIRKGGVNLKESHARLEANELWLYNCHVSPYEQANTFYKIDPSRSRKLLLHRKQIKKWLGKVQEKGLVIVPTKLYIKKNKVKVEIALARSKKLFDKRRQLKEKAIKRDIQKNIKRSVK